MVALRRRCLARTMTVLRLRTKSRTLKSSRERPAARPSRPLLLRPVELGEERVEVAVDGLAPRGVVLAGPGHVGPALRPPSRRHLRHLAPQPHTPPASP